MRMCLEVVAAARNADMGGIRGIKWILRDVGSEVYIQ